MLYPCTIGNMRAILHSIVSRYIYNELFPLTPSEFMYMLSNGNCQIPIFSLKWAKSKFPYVCRELINILMKYLHFEICYQDGKR